MKTTRWFLPLLAAILFASPAPAFADDKPAVQTISVHVQPDFTIKVGEQIKSFYDANGHPVFPIVYRGTTYLPVRAVSGLMGENVDWDGPSKTVFIGKTLKAPVKSETFASSWVRDGGVPFGIRPPVQTAQAHLKPDISILYDFVAQRFSDVNEEDVYPINYRGSVYLPIRAISRLMGESVEWDEGRKQITISDSEAEEAARQEREAEDGEERVWLLRSALSEALSIHNDATEKIAGLQVEDSAEQLIALAARISDDARRASGVVIRITRIDTEAFTEEELDAYAKLAGFAAASEHYILILENIAYLAASGQDYSMIAETFLDLALDAQAKQRLAEEAIKALSQ